MLVFLGRQICHIFRVFVAHLTIPHLCWIIAIHNSSPMMWFSTPYITQLVQIFYCSYCLFYLSHNIWTSWGGAKHWHQYGMYEWQKQSNQRTEMQHFVKWLDTLSFSTKKWGAMNFEMHEILDFEGYQNWTSRNVSLA